MKTYKKIVIIAISTIIILLTAFYLYNVYFVKHYMGLLPASLPSDTIPKNNYDVVLKDAVSSKDTNVYLKDLDTGSEIWFNTISNIYKEHYHNTEFTNGSLYVIKRFENNNDFIDELWKYDKEKSRENSGVKLFSGKGFDFRVLNNGNIAINIRTNNSNNDTIIRIIDNNGSFVREFYSKDLSIDPSDKYISLDFLYKNSVNDNYIILENTITYSVAGLTKINIKSGEIKKYKFDKLNSEHGPQSSRFNINPSLNKIVFVDSPFNFDIESEIAYLKTDKKENVIVYNLDTQEQKTIITKSNKDKIFSVKWIDDETIEYREHLISSDLNNLDNEENMKAFLEEIENEGELKTLKVNF